MYHCFLGQSFSDTLIPTSVLSTAWPRYSHSFNTLNVHRLQFWSVNDLAAEKHLTCMQFESTIWVECDNRLKVALPNFMTFSCSLTTLQYSNHLALLTKNCLKENAKKIVDLREIYNKKCNFSFCFAKQKGYNNNYIHILDSVSFKSAFLVRARCTKCTLRYWNICDASFENGSSNIWNIDLRIREVWFES